MPARQLCTFWLDRLYMGVDVRYVQGVVRHQPLTRVPLAPPLVRGLLNLRGEIIPGIDLRRRLGLAARKEEQLWMNVVLDTSSGLVSLLVDEIGEVVEVSEDQFDAPPETLAAEIHEITEAVCQLDNRLMLLLDAERAVDLGSSLETN